MSVRLLVLHGPNLNLLEDRLGSTGPRLEDLNAAIRVQAASYNFLLKIFQSNHEGFLIDVLQAERRNLDGVVVNPTSLFGSYALRDALKGVGVPAIEVYLDSAYAKRSVVKDACQVQFSGKGFDSYFQALKCFALEGTTSDDESGKATASKSRKGKTIGRKQAASEPKPETPVPLRLVGRGEPVPAVTPVKALVRTADAGGSAKTLGRKTQAADKPAKEEKEKGKTIGRGSKGASGATLLTRALVREKIAERLAGKLTPGALATWARAQFLEVQRGAPAESGYRDMLEDSLQALTLSTLPASRLSDEQLVDLMTQLEG